MILEKGNIFKVYKLKRQYIKGLIMLICGICLLPYVIITEIIDYHKYYFLLISNQDILLAIGAILLIGFGIFYSKRTCSAIIDTQSKKISIKNNDFYFHDIGAISLFSHLEHDTENGIMDIFEVFEIGLIHKSLLNEIDESIKDVNKIISKYNSSTITEKDCNILSDLINQQINFVHAQEGKLFFILTEKRNIIKNRNMVKQLSYILNVPIYDFIGEYFETLPVQGLNITFREKIKKGFLTQPMFIEKPDSMQNLSDDEIKMIKWQNESPDPFLIGVGLLILAGVGGLVLVLNSMIIISLLLLPLVFPAIYFLKKRQWFINNYITIEDNTIKYYNGINKKLRKTIFIDEIDHIRVRAVGDRFTNVSFIMQKKLIKIETVKANRAIWIYNWLYDNLAKQ